MSKILVKVSLDWADEFQCEEFKVFKDEQEYYDWTKKVRAKILGQVNDDKGYSEFYFGTNEYHEFHDYDDFERHIKVHQLSDEEAEVFRRYFGTNSFGTSGLFNV